MLDEGEVDAEAEGGGREDDRQLKNKVRNALLWDFFENFLCRSLVTFLCLPRSLLARDHSLLYEVGGLDKGAAMPADEASASQQTEIRRMAKTFSHFDWVCRINK